MRSICFYFQVHQPMRLRTYRFFDIGRYHNYYDDHQNKFILRRVADKCYIPMNSLLLEHIKEYGSAFKVSFSISGVALDQFEMYAPDVVESFRRLAETGSVEFLSETHSHSLSSLKSKDEFREQVEIHRKKVRDLLGVDTRTFRNTELIYSDGIGEMVADMGFELMLTEGAKHILGWKSPNFLYHNAINPRLKLLLKNFQLSDDIAFRFSEQRWKEWPLTTEKYVDWLNAIDPKQQVVNLFMDYETFGEHQWRETGIFDFMRALPGKVMSQSNFTFNTPSEVVEALQPVSAIHVPHPISWADEERDLTAWLGNDLQDDAFDSLYELEGRVKAIDDPEIRKDWRYLQTSDHFYYMCTKWFSDGDVHKYFNPYGTPYESYINYMNVLSDFKMRLDKAESGSPIIEKAKELGDEVTKEVKKQVGTARDAGKKVRQKWDESTVREMTLEDIAKLSNVKIQEFVRKVKLEELAIALKETSDDVRERIVPNMTRSARKQYEEIEGRWNEFRKKDVQKYRDKIEQEINKIFGKGK